MEQGVIAVGGQTAQDTALLRRGIGQQLQRLWRVTRKNYFVEAFRSAILKSYGRTEVRACDRRNPNARADAIRTRPGQRLNIATASPFDHEPLGVRADTKETMIVKKTN